MIDFLTLNDKQQEAVCADDQYLRIIAGAGSGKTRVLTYRISYLIQEKGVQPYNILAITFTNKVAAEMKTRTMDLIPEYDISSLTISTFHSFCARFLRREIELLDITRNFLIFDDEDQTTLIKNIGKDFGYKKSDEINSSALKFIEKKKTLGLLPSDINTSNLKPNEKIFYNYFLEYEKRKSQCKALDFDDLLIYTIKILKAFPDVKERYNRRFHHILVDEFQDTNDVQYELLTLLMGPSTYLYVVGDPDQTIYTWRGANQSIILDLPKKYRSIRTIIMNQNYRSTKEILKCANQLIGKNLERVKKDLFTTKDGEEPKIVSLDTSDSEASFVANQIQKMKNADKAFNFSDVAILYRSSYLSLKFENALTRLNIPYKVYGGIKFYSRKEIKDCLAYFRLLVNEDDDVSFERIINVPRRKIGETSINIISTEAKEHNLSMIKYLKNLHLYETKLKGNIMNSLLPLFEKMDEVRKTLELNYEAYSEVLDKFLTDIGYKDYLEKDDETKDKLENISALIDDVRSYNKNNPESSFLDYIQNVTLLTSQDEISNKDAVSLMTVHTAKGLEFPVVFVIGFNEGVFPNMRAVMERTNSGLEEERRLAYVAFTRAKNKLFITLNKDYSFILKSQNIPSQFIKEAGFTTSSFKISYGDANGRQIYQYNFNTNSSNVSEKSLNNYVDLSAKNGITWHVGDVAIHKVFGEGRVKEVEGDIISIDFIDFGLKKMLGSHPSLTKKE